MIAKIRLISNQAEVEASMKEIQRIESENANRSDGENLQELPAAVEPTFAESELSFTLSDVDYAYKGNDGMINIEHKKNPFKVIYEDDLWDCINRYFECLDSGLAKR